MPSSQLRNTPAVLVIRDGWGRNPNAAHDAFNAVRLAATPVADRLERSWPTTLVRTSGEDVGLPAGTVGNSEVGHQNIGAGRVVDQQVMRITRTIRDGSFMKNERLRRAFAHAFEHGGRVHLLGLASDGLVHSDINHLFALIDLAAAQSIDADRLLVHVITDGRDTAPTGGIDFIGRIEQKLRDAGIGRIATVIGRYYAMDRDHRWSRVALAYACLTGTDPGPEQQAAEGVRVRTAESAEAAVRAYYDAPTERSRTGDEFIVPTRIGTPAAVAIRPGDAVVFFNYRGDRPREITKAFVYDDDAWAAVQGGGFPRGPKIADLYFCTFADYEAGLPVAVAFERPPRMTGILGAALAERGLRQFRCAETEKFPHVTYFFNDYREEPFDGESRLVVPSPKDVTTYDQKPEMSAAGVRDGVLARLAAEDVEPFILVNFANPDMVGHTGDLEAATRAVEVVDACVGRIVDRTLARGGSVVVTADHGNAEQMWDPAAGSPHTAHTVYDVPLHVAGAAFTDRRLRPDGRLGDVAPTVLEMMGLPQPREMTGRSLLV